MFFSFSLFLTWDSCSLNRQLAFPVIFGNFWSGTGLLIFVMVNVGVGGRGMVGFGIRMLNYKILEEIRRGDPLAFFEKCQSRRILYLRNRDISVKK